jgi:hypothetical protein
MSYETFMFEHGHTLADLRHWRLHEVALEKLERHPELLPSVLALLDRWLAREELRPSRRWLEQWRVMLTAWPFDRMRETVLDKEEGQTLRQCSPLGPVLSARERWKALGEVSDVSRATPTLL